MSEKQNEESSGKTLNGDLSNELISVILNGRPKRWPISLYLLSVVAGVGMGLTMYGTILTFQQLGETDNWGKGLSTEKIYESKARVPPGGEMHGSQRPGQAGIPPEPSEVHRQLTLMNEKIKKLTEAQAKGESREIPIMMLRKDLELLEAKLNSEMRVVTLKFDIAFYVASITGSIIFIVCGALVKTIWDNDHLRESVIKTFLAKSKK